MSKCIVHKWGYEDVKEMSMKFRVCEKCGALEGKSTLSLGVSDHWHKYSPHGGAGFIEALRQKILHDTMAAEARMNAEAVEVSTAESSEVVNGD